mmetsp:Transcript_60028/g.107083  ORF Transcript_60028/g.107083 Transcript_60028/m.107083 type:complete len:99 (+) Transcript_60028:918-1214(+)
MCKDPAVASPPIIFLLASSQPLSGHRPGCTQVSPSQASWVTLTCSIPTITINDCPPSTSTQHCIGIPLVLPRRHGSNDIPAAAVWVEQPQRYPTALGR